MEVAEWRWGYINEMGKLAIAARFDEVGDFIEELAPVRIGRKWGYIDTSGRIVVEPRFQSAGAFREGLARVYLWAKASCDSRNFTTDDAPLYAFHLLDDDRSDFSGCSPQGGKFGYIDKTGTVVIAQEFVLAQDFSEGLAVVRVEGTADSKFGYIDRSGHMVIAPRFYQAGPFSEGLAAVETSARLVGTHVEDIAWGFIDKAGVIKIPDKYNFAGKFSEGLARVATKSGVSMGYIDRAGRMIIPARFDEAWDFSEGIAAACSDECVYIDRSGAEVLKNFHAWWPFSDGLAVIGFDAPQVYIDKKGHVIAPYSSDK